MRDSGMFSGLGVALATPFLDEGGGRGGALDLAAFRRLVRFTRDGGADFLVVLGSTGEAATVLPAERAELIRAAREETSGLPLVVGAGHNATAAACALAAEAAALGADGLLVVTPYYNKPQPAGLEAHYRAVAEAAPGLPIIAYNVPGRTGLNLLPRDLLRLMAIPAVVAVKESSGNLAQIGEILRTLPPGKSLLSGDDALALPATEMRPEAPEAMAGNVAPAETAALVRAALAGRREEARVLQARLLPLMDALFLETNPVPLKAALELSRLATAAVRLPLWPASAETRSRLAPLLAALAGAETRADLAVAR